jgi:hypothetical protein
VPGTAQIDGMMIDAEDDEHEHEHEDNARERERRDKDRHLRSTRQRSVVSRVSIYRDMMISRYDDIEIWVWVVIDMMSIYISISIDLSISG